MAQEVRSIQIKDLPLIWGDPPYPKLTQVSEREEPYLAGGTCWVCLHELVLPRGVASAMLYNAKRVGLPVHINDTPYYVEHCSPIDGGEGQSMFILKNGVSDMVERRYLTEIVELSPKEKLIAQVHMIRQVQREGHSAYLAGLDQINCPPYQSEDMTAYWLVGWLNAHDEHYKWNKLNAQLRCNSKCAHK